MEKQVRVGCKPSSVIHLRWTMVIPLRRQLLDASSNQPGNLGRAALKRPPIWFCSRWGLPSSRCHHRDGELLPRLFTLITPEADGIFSVALSLRSPPVRVTDHLALWSSDFPLIPSLCRRGRATTLPTLTCHYKNSTVKQFIQ